MIDAAKHVAMIKDPDRWPRWPVLALKKPGQGDRPIGVIHVGSDGYAKEGPITVYLTNIFLPLTDDTPTKVYADAEAIVDDGWVVD